MSMLSRPPTWASSINRGRGRSSACKISWVLVENFSKPDKLRSTTPRRCATRFSPAATASSRALGQVGDLRGKNGIFKIGSSSFVDGDVE